MFFSRNLRIAGFSNFTKQEHNRYSLVPIVFVGQMNRPLLAQCVIREMVTGG